MPKCYLGQLDAQNDVLVLENLEYSGYKKYAGGKYFSDVDHCKIVLRRIAHFHAFSTLIQVKQQQQQQKQQHQQQQLNVTGIWTQVKMTVWPSLPASTNRSCRSRGSAASVLG